MKSHSLLITLIIAVSALQSCGKNPGSSDKLKEELQNTVNAKESQLTPLAGRYEGTLTNIDGTTQTAVLQLIPTMIIVQNPGQNDVTEMPSLGGNLNLYFAEGDTNDVIPIAQFTNTMYDSNSGHIRLNGSYNTGSSIGTVLNTFDGQVNGSTIAGRVSNSTRGDLGYLSVKKVSTAITSN